MGDHFSIARWLAVAESHVVPELPQYALLAAFAERQEAVSDAGDAETIDVDVPARFGTQHGGSSTCG